MADESAVNIAGENAGAPAYEYTTFPRQFISYKWYKPILVGLLLFLFMFLIQIALIVVAIAWNGSMDFLYSLNISYDDMSPYDGPSALVLIGGVAALLPALALAALVVRDRPYSSYSSSRGGWNWGVFAKCLVVAVLIIGAPQIVQLLASGEASSGIRFTVGGVIACAILIPLQCVAEEYVFRGWLIQMIGAWTRVPIVAVILQAAFFAAMHPYNLIGVAAIFVDGVIWGAIAWQTKGLEATSAAHIVNNLLAFGLGGLGYAAVSSEVDWISFVLIVGIDVIFAAIVLLAGKKFNWFKSKGDGAAEFNEKRRAKLMAKQGYEQVYVGQPAQQMPPQQMQPVQPWPPVQPVLMNGQWVYPVPIQPSVPGQPTGAMAPAQQMAYGQPIQPGQPLAGGQPMAPTQSAQPTSAGQSTTSGRESAQPTESMQGYPAQPVRPMQPMASGQGYPAQPMTPGQGYSAQPVFVNGQWFYPMPIAQPFPYGAPAQPAQPQAPGYSAQPAQPFQNGNPASPAEMQAQPAAQAQAQPSEQQQAQNNLTASAQLQMPDDLR